MTETITTAAEREALLMAVGENARAACVEDRYGDPWLIVENDGGDFIAWSYPHEDYPDVHNWKMAEALEMPLTVLWRPDQPTPTVKPGEKDIIEAMVSAAPEVYAERGAVWFEAKAGDIRASAGPYACAVLALLPGRTEAEVKAEALREYATARYRAYLEDPEIPWFDQPSRLAQQYAKSLDELLAEADRIEAGGE